MAFVNELVPEEQKTKIVQNQKVFHSPWTPRLPLRPYRWVIDRDRDAFVIRLGHDVGDSYEKREGGGYRQYMALSWKGEVVKFDAIYGDTGRYLDGNLVGNWEVIDVRIPASLVSQRDTVLELIREGLDAMGDAACIPERPSKVNIRFNLQAQN